MKLRTLTAAGVAAAALLVPTAANAGGSPSTMVAMPNPTTVGTPVTVSNTANASSTCEGSSAVMVSILDPSATVVDQFEVTPDGNGDWSFGFTPDETGTWEVLAECFAQGDGVPQPGLQLQRACDPGPGPRDDHGRADHRRSHVDVDHRCRGGDGHAGLHRLSDRPPGLTTAPTERCGAGSGPWRVRA
ncbi:MAG: hypothetical protein R2699_11105 [Acidimicrobiales bacterium]